ncbi:MAG: family 16 glycoside hydrolase [Planctomycetota bacterium]|jgi:HEAT repeat protein
MRRDWKPLPTGLTALFLAASLLVCVPTAAQRSAPTLDEAFARASGYEFGQSRIALIVITDAVSDALDDPARRRNLERQLVGLLEDPGATRDCRDFACRQLARIGTAHCVPALANLLSDDEQSHLARYALQRIPDAAASAALRNALDELEGPLLVGAINSLAERRDASALGALAQLADARDRSVAVASIAAIGRLGTPAAAEVLIDLAAAAPDPEAATALTDALLVCADERSREHAWEQAAGLYRAVLAGAGARHVRMAAIRGLAETEGPAAAPLIVELLGHDEQIWRGFGAELVRSVRHPGATQTYVAALEDLPSAQQTALITALGDRGDAAALPALLQALQQPDPHVRRAALRAVGSLGDGTAVPGLSRLAVSSDEQDAALARASLRELRSDNADAAIARRVAAAGPAERIELIAALGDRGASAHTDVVLATARDADAGVRRASFTTLEQIGRPRDLHTLVSLLVSAPEQDRRGAEAAVTAACLRMDDFDERSRPIVSAMQVTDASGRRSLLAVMSRIGGDRALAAARDALGDPTLHDAAVAALAAWPDDAPAPDLAELASAARGTETGRVALRGYVRLAGLDQARPPGATVAMYRKAFNLSDTVEDSRLVLAGLAGVDDLDALALAQASLDEPELGDAAALAVVAIAEGIGPAHRDEALNAIHDAISRHGGPEVRRRAGEAANRIEADDDFVTAWLVAGPFSREGAGPTKLFDIEFAPERDSAAEPVAWPKLAVTNPEAPGIFNLGKAVGGGNRCVYVRTHVWSDRERAVRLELGSDDGIKAWLNGAVVHGNNALRGLTVGSDRVNVDLREGRNTLLLKITQGGGDWSFCCRVRDPLGYHADGVRFATEQELASPPAGASILLDGARGRAWRHADGTPVRWRVEDEALVVRPGTGSIMTRQDYQDFILHAGFLIPEGLSGSGQARGNSGIYLLGRYEVQVLDSWQSEVAANGCGAIYGRVAPRVNASRPPGSWQEYLIDFTAPHYDGGDRKTRNARISVWHNGLLIHDDVEIEGTTGRGAPESPAAGPILLQDHGHPIRFRDIWIVPRPPAWEGPAAQGFVALFDGRTLEGWHRLGGRAWYHVEDGQIVGVTRPHEPNSFLCTERTFEDFVLELEFRVDPQLNSGIQIRSNSFADYRDGRVHGYQVEIDPSDRAWSGGIYDEARRGWLAPLEDDSPARQAFRQDAWNRLRVVAKGDTIQTWLNGVAAAQLVDSMTRRGFIGLQVHGVGERADPLEVRWRDIRIRELDLTGETEPG